ncbi:hypothetical protein DMO24_24145 [Modestobacter versicolor]|uniref:Uncharacterized protein n=1 Tax=Modestobacter versicolor TaxID=429133 RepID=A0A323V221_9ACTN|nr:hypothetical protein DMO24_24145 [Modestobacter versicolor]
MTIAHINGKFSCFFNIFLSALESQSSNNTFNDDCSRMIFLSLFISSSIFCNFFILESQVMLIAIGNNCDMWNTFMSPF